MDDRDWRMQQRTSLRASRQQSCANYEGSPGSRRLFDLTMTSMLRGFEQSRLIATISLVIAARSGRTRRSTWHVH